MLTRRPRMFSYSVGYSATKDQLNLSVALACDLVGVAGFEPAASSSRRQRAGIPGTSGAHQVLAPRSVVVLLRAS